MTTQNWATNHHKEAARVGAKYNLHVGYPQSRYEVVLKAPMMRHGRLAFVLLTAGWFCDECGEKVIPSKFEEHAKKIH